MILYFLKYRPSPTREPISNWGLGNLSQAVKTDLELSLTDHPFPSSSHGTCDVSVSYDLKYSRTSLFASVKPTAIEIFKQAAERELVSIILDDCC